MKIFLDSPINKYYVQTLGMIFFPGARFGENEEEDENAPSLSVKTVEEEGGIRAFATVCADGGSESAEYFAEYNPDRTNERVLKLAIGGAVLTAASALLGSAGQTQSCGHSWLQVKCNRLWLKSCRGKKAL